MLNRSQDVRVVPLVLCSPVIRFNQWLHFPSSRFFFYLMKEYIHLLGS